MNTLLTSRRGDKSGRPAEDWQNDIRTVVRGEIDLVKAEVRGSVRPAAFNAALAIAGGALALFGLFILLLGGAAWLAMALQSREISPAASYAISFGALGLFLVAAGGLMLRKCLAGLAALHFNTQKAIARLHGEEVPIHIRNGASATHLSGGLKADVAEERSKIMAQCEELKRRSSPAYAMRSAFGGLRRHPLRALMVGSTLGGLFWWRNRQHT